MNKKSGSSYYSPSSASSVYTTSSTSTMQSSSTTPSSTTTSSSSPPKALNKAVIPLLTQGLDASVVLECYALIRSTPLHGLANSTLAIHKTSIGIRYRPPNANAVKQAPMELTLEYGPARVGSHDSIPYVSDDFLTWENQGMVWYTTEMVKENYASSYYMASMTGAVLVTLLEHAVDYAAVRQRYQPFAVYQQDNKALRSSSSQDFVRFVWQRLAMLGVEIDPILSPPVYEARIHVQQWQRVTVDPQVTRAAATFYQRLYTCLEAIATNDYEAWEPTAAPTLPGPDEYDDTFLPKAGDDAVDNDDGPTVPTDDDDAFGGHARKNFIRRADQTNETSAAPTESPSPGTPEEAGTEDVELTPPSDDYVPDDEDDDVVEYHATDSTHAVEEDNDSIPASSPAPSTPTLEDDDMVVGSNKDTDDDFVAVPTGNPVGETTTEGSIEEAPPSDDHVPEVGDDDVADIREKTVPLEGDSSPPAASPAPSTGVAPTANDMPTGRDEDVEKAQQAAQDAQKAADEAKNAAHTEGETKAADAAQAAADAAKAAADATTNAVGQVAMDGILSGDGDLMASIVTTCFTNPKYGIGSVDENGTVTAHAFLYKESSVLYKLELEAPYIDIVKISRSLPKPNPFSDRPAGGDFIDWLLALCVLGAVLLMVLVIVQQMGFRIVNSLFYCQRWFFNPRKYDYEGNAIFENDDDDEEHVFRFGEDGIPLSMGGRLTNESPIRYRDFVPDDALDARRPPDEGLQIPTLSNTVSPRKSPVSSAGGSFNLGDVELSTLRRRIDSMGSMSDDSVTGDEIPVRLARDPELVDLPHLKSTSKVAIPVGTPSSEHKRTMDRHNSSMSSDDGSFGGLNGAPFSNRLPRTVS